MKKNILVTGGAGFIGSNLVEALLKDDRVGIVRVLDNLSTGFLKNLEEFQSHAQFELVIGDIRDYEICSVACEGIDLISHQAALGSVPRSINDPITTNNVNIGGTLNIFQAAVSQGVNRVVFAASSSTYGDSEKLPKVEHEIGNPLSPYAVTKFVKELYAEVFSKTYDFNYIGLRYFNVFGPKQDPFGAYAAVIPLFINAAIGEKVPTINGDGTYSRDFTYVDNAVQANVLSLFSENEKAVNEVYNIAYGEKTTLNQLWSHICEISGYKIEPKYDSIRAGDIPHSLADISKAIEWLNYHPQYSIKKGLIEAFQWYKKNLK